MLVNNPVKFHKDILKRLTSYRADKICDRLTDGQSDDPGKRIMSPTPEGGGGHNKSTTGGTQFVPIGIPTICLYNLVSKSCMYINVMRFRNDKRKKSMLIITSYQQ